MHKTKLFWNLHEPSFKSYGQPKFKYRDMHIFLSIFRAIARDVIGALSIGDVIIANGHFVILSANNQ